MSNALGISPAVMINPLVHETGKASATHLAEVSRLRGELQVATQGEAMKAAAIDPAAPPSPPVPVSGADVDRLV